MNYYPRFAHLIEEYLSAADRSAAWLAQQLGVNPSTVARWRSGEVRPKSPEVVTSIADRLGVYAPDKRREFLGAADFAYVESHSTIAMEAMALAEVRMAGYLSFNLELTDAVLIATLGSEPQVISLAAQLLLRQSEPLTSVVVLHTAANRGPIAKTLPALTEAFAQHPKWPALQTLEVPADDVIIPEQIELFARALYQVLKEWKERGVRVHLLLAGGRKSMAMVGTSVAQLLLGPDDRLWYLYSDDALRLSGRFYLEGHDHAQLVQVPLPQMNSAPPVFTRSFQAETPEDAHMVLEETQERRRRFFVEDVLTPAERELAALVVQDVLTVEEAARQLNKQPKTVNNQLNTIYSKLEAVFGLQPGKGVKREFLRNQLRGYFR